MAYPSDRHRNGKPIRTSAPTERKCTRCKIVKPLATGFYRDNGRPVLNGHEYRCKECAREVRRLSTRTPHGQFVMAKQISKRTGREFTLTEDEYRQLRNKPCRYCFHNLTETGLGMDRLDNSRGYVLGNVVPCCEVCNSIKSNIFTEAEMCQLGIVVFEIRRKRLHPLMVPRKNRHQ